EPDFASLPTESEEPRPVSLYPARIRRLVLMTFAVSGFASLANEVVWTRMLILYLGTSVYAFSAMLALILMGMGVGSFYGGKFVDRWRDPLHHLAHLQFGIALVGALALHLFAWLTPHTRFASLII